MKKTMMAILATTMFTSAVQAEELTVREQFFNSVKSAISTSVDATDEFTQPAQDAIVAGAIATKDGAVVAGKATGAYLADGAKDTVSNTLTSRLLSSDYSGIKNPALAGAAVMGTVVVALPLAVAADIIMAPFKLLIEKDHVDAVIDAGQDKAGDIVGGLKVEHDYADSSDETYGVEHSLKFVNVWNNDDVDNADFDLVYKHGNIKTSDDLKEIAKSQ